MAPLAADDPQSALAGALAAVGDRWTLLIVAALMEGTRRFADLQSEVRGIAPNVLTARLRTLERDGLVSARPYSQRPPRLEYELSASGWELAGALALLTAWGARHGGAGATPRHGACGTPLEARWWCPVCEEPAAEAEPDELRFV
jgi:DNA-binding HxlR family transcriptional regulator